MLDGLYLNYPSWSISAEMMAYLVFPVLVYVVLKIPANLAFPATVAVFLAVYVVSKTLLQDTIGNSMFQLTFRFTFLRIWPEFLMGLGMAYLVLDGRSVRPVLLLVPAVLLMISGIATGAVVLFVLAMPLLIGGLYLWDVRVPRWARYLGVISYSIYMVHGLVEMTLFTVLEKMFGYPVDMVPDWMWPIPLGLVVLCGAVVHHVVEIPVQRRIMRVWNRQRSTVA